jgi:hypothetical protein
MDARLFRKTLLCGGLSILTIAGTIFIAGYLLHLHVGFLPALFGCFALAVLIYGLSWLEQGFFLLFCVIFIGAVLAVLFQELPSDVFNLFDFSIDTKKKEDRKSNRQMRVQMAIAKRKLRLQKLLNINI